MKHLFYIHAKYMFAFVVACISTGFNASAQSAVSANNHQYNTSDNRLAIQGYDPVSYFSDNEAREGKKDISYNYDDVTYRFTSQQHLQSFKSNPTHYLPQYGGWCAYAMGATGEKVDVDPETFKLINGKLYLFYNRFFNNTKKSWDKDEANLKQKADANWQKIVR